MKKVVEAAVIFVFLAGLIYFGRPRLVAFYNNKGIKYCNCGLYKEAVTVFKKALKLGPFMPGIHYNLASTYAEMGTQDKAIKEYKKLIQLKPDYARAYLDLSRIYFQSQDYQEALNLLGKAKTVFPSDQRINKLLKDINYECAVDYVNRGIKSFLAEDMQKAHILLKKAIEIEPDLANAHYSLAHFYISNNNYKDAKDRLKQAIDLKPDFLAARKLLGDLYYEKGNYRKAISMYRTALSLNYDDVDLRHNLGLALMNIENYRKAIVHLEKARELSPNNFNICYSLASTYRDEGMFENAVLEYKKILHSLPEYPNVHNDLGDIYIQQQQEQEAFQEYHKEIKYCRQRLLISPNEPSILNGMAYAYNGIKESYKAKDIIDEVLTRWPSYRQAYLTLAKIEEKMDEPGKALAALNKARLLSSQPDFIDRDILRLKKRAGLSSNTFIPFDKVYLKNGNVLEGIIKEETEKRIVLSLRVGKSWGTIDLYRDRIKRIVRTDSSKK